MKPEHYLKIRQNTAWKQDRTLLENRTEHYFKQDRTLLENRTETGQNGPWAIGKCVRNNNNNNNKTKPVSLRQRGVTILFCHHSMEVGCKMCVSSGRTQSRQVMLTVTQSGQVKLTVTPQNVSLNSGY